jgi:signal transduction histidine kinase
MPVRIVVVDEEHSTLAMIARILEAGSRTVTTFCAAGPALESLEAVPPDVCIVDLDVPGTSGEPCFAAELRRRFGSSLAILGTVRERRLHAHDPEECGADTLLCKPILDAVHLETTIGEVLGFCARRSKRAAPGPARFVPRMVAYSPGPWPAGRSSSTAVLDRIADAILIADGARRLVLVNPAALRLLEWEAHAVLGRPLGELPLEPPLLRLLEAPELLEAGPAGVHLERTDRRIEVTRTALAGGQAGRAGEFFVLRDVTAEVRVQELKSHYLTVVSHELRTPLTALGNFVSLLGRRLEPGTLLRQDGLVEAIRQQVLRLEHQIDKLILLARLDREELPGDGEPFDLGEAVRHAVESCRYRAMEQGTRLLAGLSRDPVHALGDPEDVRRAVFELIENAVKFTPTGGTVEVTLEATGQEALVRVKDTGIGIDPRDHQSVFDAFRQLEKPLTRTYGGAGLGLALVRRIVAACRGDIELESEVGQGSSFTLRLPRANMPVESKTAELAANGERN